ncbi:hypothetical protein E3O42_02550 [Cryobacterium adonitolivorans]|uniref:Hemagglutinin n=1 Tax=Cryobacterium adonitolivorans TaxID=1259189 RepID=A0A4R8WDQ9_9MICO|nr:hypothetical protein [Cryobacterium adonitolivorans]TFC05468.1 hypothetical protein E3O42_02550 [Cryobacterium adonitolivorans]
MFALVLGFLTVGATTTQDSAEAANGSDFNAGNIISDAEFYNSGAMSANEIQAFLNAKVPNCRSGYVCLKDYSQATASQGAKSEGCAAYQGSASESAATIVYKVGIACGINPQALLVLLEKEQALIRDAWPTARQYRSATGYGCPDTADCDANFYGFFNQVYNAAYQFKKYQANPGSRGYVAGRWNTIQWNPNAGCGSSNVYIENQATAGLYVYTPYRPNDAALNNMYGTGDGCSSYGNRNFWAIFTDWFGDTHGGSSIVRDTSSGGLFLIAGTVKYPIPTMDVYNALANLGSYRDVPASYLTGYSTGQVASELVRNPLTGEIALVQGNSRHRFSTCNQVGDWGFDCSKAIDLMPGQWGKLPGGGDVSAFVVQPGTSTVYYLNAATRFPVDEWAGVLRLNGGASPWVGTIRNSAAERFPVGRVLATPATAIKSGSSSDVFYVDGWGSRIRIPSMAVLAEFGLNSIRTVSDNVVNGYPRAGADLTVVVNCNGTEGLVNGGVFSPLSSNGTGIPVTPLTGPTCAALGGGATIASAAFVITPGSPEVFLLTGGAARPVWGWSDVLRLNNGSAPVISSLTADTVRGLPQPGGVVAPYSLVKSNQDATVWVTDGLDRKLRLDSFGTSDALGLASWRVVSDRLINAYATTGATLSRVVSCAGTTYIGLGGTLYSVSGSNPHGLPVAALGDGCGVLNRSGAAPLERVFLKSSDSAVVYYLVNGQRRTVRTWADLVAANGGSGPQVFTVNGSEISTLPDGGAL